MEWLIGLGILGLCYCVRVREKTRLEIAKVVEHRLLETDENHAVIRVAELQLEAQRERLALGDGIGK